MATFQELLVAASSQIETGTFAERMNNLSSRTVIICEKIAVTSVIQSFNITAGITQLTMKSELTEVIGQGVLGEI